jgi:small conductance mechanosensitive channel
MRFVELENALGATIFIPNRTINNIINYPRGYVRCIVDVTLNGTEEQRGASVDITKDIVESVHQQFHGIFITRPSLEGRIILNDIKEILRIKFRIWPNRGQPIETTFVKELTEKLKETDPKYESWMIAISYEVEKKKKIDLKTFRWMR